ncbi:MAG TPA: Immediate early protein ICP0 [Myxococcus sp.]|nr:Immediate early protein ICP0 [Myxococcus sp.]
MSSLRVLSRAIRLPGLDTPPRPEGPPPEEMRRPRPGDNDAFRNKAIPLPGRPAIAGDVPAPVKTVGELVPPDLEEVPGQEELAHRFASDAALLAAHLKPSQLPGSERAQRLWAFYAAYAAAAAALPGKDEAKEAFREGLKGQGFAELHDAHTGENGVARGLWVLESRHPAEARERAATVRLEPPPEVLHSEAVARQDSSMAGLQAPRGTWVPVALEQRSPWEQAAELPRRLRSSFKRLSPHMFWNVLHTFRDSKEDGAVAEGQWERVVFAAILALTGIVLVVVALVSL